MHPIDLGLMLPEVPKGVLIHFLDLVVDEDG